jgi:acyl CoA:acetate/3-ketoacid CoA transferase beta subunit
MRRLVKPTAIVLDGYGNPLPDVHVNFAFGISFQSRIGNVQSGPSDDEGKFSASMKTDGQLTVTATKEGYYQWQDSSMFFSPDVKTGKFSPLTPPTSLFRS